MTTIATDILRDFEARRTNLRQDHAAEAGGCSPARQLMRDLCEQAHGIRLSFNEWVFPDGSELQT